MSYFAKAYDYSDSEDFQIANLSIEASVPLSTDGVGLGTF